MPRPTDRRNGSIDFDRHLADELLHESEGRSRLECALATLARITGAREVFLARHEQRDWVLESSSGQRVTRADSWAVIGDTLAAELDAFRDGPTRDTDLRTCGPHALRRITVPGDSTPRVIGLYALPEDEEPTAVVDRLPWSRVVEVIGRLVDTGNRADAPIFDLARLNEILPATIVLLTDQGRYIWWDPANIAATFGVPGLEDRIPGHFVTDGTRGELMQHFQRLMHEGRTRFMAPILTESREFTMLLSAGVLGAPGATPSTALVAGVPLHDVENLGSVDHFFRQAFSTSPRRELLGPIDGTWEANRMARTLLTETTDVPPEEALELEGCPLRAVVRERLSHSGTVYLEGIRRRGRDGAPAYAALVRRFGPPDQPWVHVELLEESAGSPSSAVLAEARSLAEQYIDSIPIATIHWDHAGRILSWNQAAERLFGHRREEVVGRSLVDAIVPEDQRAFVQQRMHEIVSGTGGWYARNYNVTRSGERILSEWYTTYIESLGSQGPFFVSSALDVTATFEDQRERILAIARQRDALVREVHHRVKNGLQGIVGLLRMKAQQSPEELTVLEGVIGQVEAMASVFGLVSRNPGVGVPVADMLRDFAERLGHEQGCRFDVNADSVRGLTLNNDHSVLAAVVVYELMQNACKHRSRGGEESPVAVTAHPIGQGALLRVTNRISDPDLTIDIASGSGLGTGLSIVRTLCRKSALELSFRAEEQAITAALRIKPAALTVMHDPDQGVYTGMDPQAL
jgi:PAS domain S-box-containing protein